MLWTAGLPPAVLVAPSPLFGSSLCVCFSATTLSGRFKVHFSITSRELGVCPAFGQQGPDLACPTALPQPTPSGCVERRGKGKERGIEAADCVRFIYYF